MNFDDSPMPPDPFAGDPNDPASFLGPDDLDDGINGPLSEEERAAVKEDLENVRCFRGLLEPRGVRGISMMCEECGEEHFYDWPIIIANLTTMLNEEAAPVHEPSAAPDPDYYVSWEYCAGYADAVDWMNSGPRAYHRRWL